MEQDNIIEFDIGKFVRHLKNDLRLLIGILCISLIAGIGVYAIVKRQAKASATTAQSSASQYYTATAYVAMDWDTSLTKLDVSADQSVTGVLGSAYVESALKATERTRESDILNNIKALSSSDEVVQKVNQKLVDAGYDELGSDDVFSMTVNTIKTYSVTANGKGNGDRTAFIANSVAEILMRESKDDMEKDSSHIVTSAVAYRATKSTAGAYTRVYGEDTTAATTATSRAKKYGVATTVLIILIVLLVVAVRSMKDKLIYSRSDLDQLQDLKFLGSLKEEDLETVAAVAYARCKVLKLHRVMLTCAADDGSVRVMKKLAEEMSGEDLQVEVMLEAQTKSETIRHFGDFDGIVLFVTCEQNDIDMVRATVEKIHVAEANLVGCVLG